MFSDCRAHLRATMWPLLFALSACSARGRSPDQVELRHTLPAVHVTATDAGPASTPAPARLVRASAWGTFGEAERIADLQVAPAGAGSLLAWVTYVDPPPPAARGRERGERRTASVFVRPIDQEGEALATPKLISSKAVATGGVSLPSDGRDHITLAWTGLDAGRAQVFLTQVSANGERQLQRMLTHAASDCSDVAMTAAAGDGFLVAWVEQQGASAAIEVARVGADLRRVGEVRKIAQTGGDASQLRLVAHGDDAWLVWAEVRTGSEQSGIFGLRLSSRDGSARDDVTRLFALSHPESLRLVPSGDGWALGWIEGPAAGAAATKAVTNRHAALAGLGRARTRDVARVEVPADLTSLALDCEATCHVVAAGARADALELYAWTHDFSANTWSPPESLGSLSGASPEDITPVLRGPWLFFAQDDLNGKGRIGKSRLFWPPK
jgi:hypothetical protein